ncbi:cyclic nucleotide-binding domain protein [Buttiauxella gaviniae ATCC 51604]|uniref:Cyclic nucleotide-binding domain protein n=1 Tax=Buttiauxella gaviniae ATCC 51604 TaxID=1354253 RepID=A0A1B7I3P7_9ENTR|nr:helix-turn-helix domain-containing protein [Buttiauxella gaviniae]OAT22952.1 cyclic nucleotide-binding domain protein [Buttiauxella gaviniae ATCC 51604]
MTNIIADNTKVIKCIREIIAGLSPKSEKVCFEENSLIFLNQKKQFYMLLEGELTIRSRDRRHIVARLVGPVICGLGIMEDVYLQTTSYAVFRVLPREQAFEIITQKNLWQVMFYIVHNYAAKVCKWNDILTQMSSYEVICETLKRLEGEPTNIKYSITALQYVQEKTGLSRSYILKIIGELKVQKKVTIQRGVLTGLKHTEL